MDVCCFDDFGAFGVTPLPLPLLKRAECAYSTHFSHKSFRISDHLLTGDWSKVMKGKRNVRLDLPPRCWSVDQTLKPLQGVIVLMSDPGDSSFL